MHPSPRDEIPPVMGRALAIAVPVAIVWLALDWPRPLLSLVAVAIVLAVVGLHFREVDRARAAQR